MKNNQSNTPTMGVESQSSKSKPAQIIDVDSALALIQSAQCRGDQSSRIEDGPKIASRRWMDGDAVRWASLVLSLSIALPTAPQAHAEAQTEKSTANRESVNANSENLPAKTNSQNTRPKSATQTNTSVGQPNQQPTNPTQSPAQDSARDTPPNRTTMPAKPRRRYQMSATRAASLASRKIALDRVRIAMQVNDQFPSPKHERAESPRIAEIRERRQRLRMGINADGDQGDHRRDLTKGDQINQNHPKTIDDIRKESRENLMRGYRKPTKAEIAALPIAVDVHGKPKAKLSKDQENALITLAHEGNLAARNALILSMHQINRMCASRAFKRNQSTPIDEMMQDGVFGVLRSIELFDVSRPTRLSTYAAVWASSTIGRAAARKAAEDIPWNPDDSYVDERGIKRWNSYSLSSLDDDVNEDGVALRETVAQHVEIDEDSRISQKQIDQIVRGILREITDPRHVQIIQRRWLSDEPETLQDLAMAMGMSREGVRQMEAKVLRIVQARIAQELPAYMADASPIASPNGRMPTANKADLVVVKAQNRRV